MSSNSLEDVCEVCLTGLNLENLEKSVVIDVLLNFSHPQLDYSVMLVGDSCCKPPKT